jgi:hypothetical protein
MIEMSLGQLSLVIDLGPLVWLAGRIANGLVGLPSQPQRLSHHDEVAVIAASVPMEVTSAGDQHQSVRSGLLERLALGGERLSIHFPDRRDSIFEPMRVPTKRDRVAHLDSEQPSEKSNSIRV